MPDSLYTPELLAPAGKAETFFAALDAGADAVYLGLDKFNARLKAENFSLKDLSRLLPFAHERGRKVYVALNTLIKQAELPEAVCTLSGLAALEADAIIVADWGLLALARERFPGLRLHASTQMGFHNSAGTAAAERLGFRRVILARELTHEELALVRERTGIELEVFVHGALCYSLSGFCLASSFIGGAGGNRGLCTQVCRRGFRVRGQPGGRKEVPFFSPRDLELLDRLPGLLDLKINAFKIEGRLKGGAYVRTVVSAYRRAIDCPESIPDIKQDLQRDYGRAKTTFFFDAVRGRIPGDIIQEPEATNAVGVRLGDVIENDNRRLVLKTAEAVAEGDSVRIQPRSGFEGKRHVVAAAAARSGRLELLFHTPVSARPGDQLYLVDRKDHTTGGPPRLPAPRSFSIWPYAKALAAVLAWGSRRKTAADASAWSLKMDRPAWLPLAAATKAKRLLLDLAEAGEAAVAAILSLDRGVRQRLAVGLPVFIPETDLDEWRHALRLLSQAGVTRFFCGNAGLLTGLFDPPLAGISLEAAPGANVLNVPARALLRSLGISGTGYSLEDDFLNIRHSSALPAAFTIYGPAPLFISRADPALPNDSVLYDRHDNAFLAVRRGGLSWLLGKQPICLFQKREKLESLGVRDFIIDLSFSDPDQQRLTDILTAYHAGRRLHPSTLFNFKRELT